MVIINRSSIPKCDWDGLIMISGPEQERDHGLVFYKIDLHREVEEPRFQAEV